MLEISLIILILFIIIIFMYNNLISIKNQVNNAKASIDVYLKKRFDLIPNLVEVTKGYKEYESKTFSELTKIRGLYTDGENIEKDMKLNDRFNKTLILAESYPNLKASESFIKLQEELSKLEDELQAARRYYNSSVTEYNTKISTIPYNIIANIFSLKEIKLYEVKKSEKKNIKVEID